VDQLKPLRPLETYQVTLFIGHPSSEERDARSATADRSVVTGKPRGRDEWKSPSLKRILSAFQMDLQPLYLPKLGGADPVYLKSRARTLTAGRARIEFIIQNNLLQSFLLRANERL